MSKKQVLILVFISLLIVCNSILFIMAQRLFPAHGGFTRYILFIHPDEGENTGGYFIIIDELASDSQEYDIEWVLHGRGTLNISNNMQSLKYSTQSYLSNDNISLNVSFLTPIQQITTHEGLFSPAYRYEGADKTTTYFKARYSGSSNPLMGTVLYPNNESDISIDIPQISPVDSTQVGQIGTLDLIYYQPSQQLRSFVTPNAIVTDSRAFFIHKNASDSLKYFFVQDSTRLSFAGQSYFTSSTPVKYLLVTYANASNEITGYMNIEESVTGSITIHVPFTVASLIVDEVSQSFTPSGSSITFNLKNGPFIISNTSLSGEIMHPEQNPLQTPKSYDSFPSKATWEFNLSKITNLAHPYVLFNDTELDALRQKINQSIDPWKDWYDTYTSDVDTLKNINIDTLAEDERWVPTHKLTIKFAIDGGQDYLNKLTELLLDMPNIADDYTQDLKRADAVRAYSFAFDVIYNNLTAYNRSLIATSLHEHALPLSILELYSDNNHRCRDAGGLGLAGLVLKKKEFIDISTEALLIYLYEKVRPDGGSYEGQSYGASSFYDSIEFLFALKRFSEFNIFDNSRYLNMLDFMAQCLSPLALPPLFEDCVADGRTNDILLMSAAQIDDMNKAKEYQWLWESRQNNSDLSGLDTYTYLLDYGVHLQLIACYDVATKLNTTRPNYTSNVYGDSGMVFLRSDYSQDALFLSLSCKHFPQSHPHYDENSFELWAYGAWLIHNPGYPGWGKTGHDYVISTEAANTLLINYEEQLAEKASGLKSSILSPYFEIIEADATRAYNSPGSMAESLHPYILMIITFALLGASAFLYLHARYSIQKRLASNQAQQDPSKLKLNPAKNKGEQAKEYAYLHFLRDAFISPISLQKRILLEDQKDNVKRFKLLVGGIILLILFFFVFNLVKIFNFHIGEVILTWQLPFTTTNVYLLEVGLFVIILLLTLFAYYTFIRLFARVCNTLCSDCDSQFGDSRIQLRASYSVSLAWQLPVFGFASLLIGLTVLQSLGSFFRTLFQSVGGTGEVVNYLFTILNEAILVLLFISLFAILFFIITMRSTGYAISLKSESRITTWNGNKLAIASNFIILSILFMLFLAVFFSLSYFISTLGMEALTGG
ncbi:MAG: heparinase II/III family protein [Candidatus Helarchaeota archaeon]|nr:heparinase II/III family protein [Candidatus Helarchaeota archaeon]